VTTRLQGSVSVFDQERILPRIVHWALRQSSFTEYRHRLVPAVEGHVEREPTRSIDEVK
jgi:hypothetical protein